MTIRGFPAGKTARRVAYVHDTNTYGGVEVFLLGLLKYLDPQRYAPIVVVPGYTDPDRGSPVRLVQQVQDMGIPLVRLAVRSNTPGLGLVTQIQETRQIFADNKFDLVHIHTCRPLGARIATIGARCAHVPAIVRTEHWPPMNVTVTMRFAVKLLDLMTDYILTVSEATLNDQVRMLHRDRKKLYRSYGGIELDRFNSQRDAREAKRKIGLDADVPVVGFVGRLAQQKGVADLVKAAQRVIGKYGPVNFLLIGEGPLEQQLRQLVDELNLRQHFHFTGFKQQVGVYMEAMDIGVMPSLWEAFPLALLEFMAMSIPTVTSSLPCFREAIVDDESGLLASLDEENSLADHLLLLLRDRDKANRIGQAALERVRSQFTIQRLANDMMDLYDGILRSKSTKHTA